MGRGFARIVAITQTLWLRVNMDGMGIKMSSEKSLITSPPQPVAVTIKPLVWDHVSIYGWVFARGGILSYAIMLSVNRVYGVPGPNDGAAQFETIELAKAAAQADYEARILSALTIHPADLLSDPRVVALVEAAQALAEQAFMTMTGGRQDLIDDVSAALRAIGGEV